jgi:O-acetyl-ADP-ribose deacetylase (regulator of RNase III)
MIVYTIENIFNSKAQVLVNPINCVGVMGKGLALEFKNRYPAMADDYVFRCVHHEVKLGEPYLYKGIRLPWILQFPTKNHWRDTSRLEDIENGLVYFANNYKEWNITSIAFPQLGCGLGGLDWKDVKKVMEKTLKNVDMKIEIHMHQERHLDVPEKN